MKTGQSIRDSIKRLTQSSGIDSYMVKVLSIQEASLTCTVQFEENGLVLDKVRLKAVETFIKEALIKFPKIDSYVIITRVEKSDEWYVSMTSDLEKIWLRGDTYNSTRADKVAERIARLESAFSAFQSKFNAHVHPETGVTTSPPTVPSSEVVTPETTEGDIQNDKVKHG